MNIRILLVEDDTNIRTMAAKFLERAGFIVDQCADGNDALIKTYDNNYDLIVLDIMLPGLNGHEILSELRTIQDTPVLIMTALGDDENQLKAFNELADDYLIKPFSMEVLVKHVEAILRRSGVLKKELKVGALSLFPETLEVSYDSAEITLTPKEFEILMLFAQNAGKIIPHERLLIKIWGYDFDGNEGIIHANIKKLRDKLPAPILQNVKGVGYKLELEHE